MLPATLSSPVPAFIVAGAVWVGRTTTAHITANATAATASTAALAVKRSPNSHTLKAILTIGSMITRKGWETRSGPTCSAAYSRNKAATPPAARAYTGQCVNIPPTPNWVKLGGRRALYRPGRPPSALALGWPVPGCPTFRTAAGITSTTGATDSGPAETPGHPVSAHLAD
jgi:hypothetical protein